MTIQNVLDNCNQRKRDLGLFASKFDGQDPEAEVNQTCIDLNVAIDAATTAANQAELNTLIT